MLSDLVDRLVSLGQQTQNFRTQEIPGGKLLVRDPDGSIREVDKDEVNISDVLLSFESFREWANNEGQRDCFIAVSDTSVLIEVDRMREHMKDKATLNFKKSAAFVELESWLATPRGVKLLVRGLRTTLHETCSDEYRSIFKRLDFKRKSDGSKSASHTGESMGRSVEMEAQSSAGEIPEMLHFTLPLYSNVPSEDIKLSFAVEVDADSEVVAIHEVGDCIEKAKQATRKDLVTRLSKEFGGALVVEATA